MSNSKKHKQSRGDSAQPASASNDPQVSRRGVLKAGMGLTAGAFLNRISTRADHGGSAPLDQTDQTANPIVLENRLEGSDGWKITNFLNDIEGFAYPPSINVGEYVEFFVSTSANRFDIEIYRSGHYAGRGGRLIETVPNVRGKQQDSPHYDHASGMTSCTNWDSSHRLTIPTDWVSGIYIAKFINRDTRGQNFALFVVRDDARQSPLLFQQSLFTFHAYNNYGRKSLYSSNSCFCKTASKHERAVKVSLYRPYAVETYPTNNIHFGVEHPMLRWLEAQGYDLTYTTDLDTHFAGRPDSPNKILDHQILLIVGHDEYWTQSMRDAVTQARDSGVHLGVFSSNTCYWRVRLENDPWADEPDSVIVCYKSTEAGPDDPSGHPTGTSRDPDGVNDPENALVGIQYVGDNDRSYFPLRVSSEYGKDRIYRHTDLQDMPENSYINLGGRVIGWEWDAVSDNGHSPQGLEILAASPVYSFLLNDAGNFENGYSGITHAHVTRYVADSGAIVFASGTNLWAWGLGARHIEDHPVDPYMQQITYNILADMGLQPDSPTSDLILDDQSGMITSPPSAFLTAETQHIPVFSNIFVHQSDDGLTTRGRSVTFTWNTDVPTSGQVWIGEDRDRIREARGFSPEYTLSHSLSADLLKPATTYYYVLVSVDENANIAVSSIREFVTKGNLFVATGIEVNKGLRTGRCWAEANPALAAVSGAGVAAANIVTGTKVYGKLRRRKAKSTAPDEAKVEPESSDPPPT